MENASKALLIAGGVLITMLVVSLIVYARGMISDYYDSQQELTDIEDTTKFNLQFTNYDRKDVTGNELLSLVNKVIDYNERKSSVGNNDDQSNPIKIVINLTNSAVTDNELKENLTFDKNIRLFSTNPIIQSNTINSLKSILDKISGYESSEKNIELLSKNIKNIFIDGELTGNEDEDLVKQQNALNKFNSISTSKQYVYTTTNVKDKYSQMKNENENKIKEYYEYIQFKKGLFNCYEITYKTETGKVENITFNFSGNLQ